MAAVQADAGVVEVTGIADDGTIGTTFHEDAVSAEYCGVAGDGRIDDRLRADLLDEDRRADAVARGEPDAVAGDGRAEHTAADRQTLEQRVAHRVADYPQTRAARAVHCRAVDTVLRIDFTENFVALDERVHIRAGVARDADAAIDVTLDPIAADRDALAVPAFQRMVEAARNLTAFDGDVRAAGESEADVAGVAAASGIHVDAPIGEGASAKGRADVDRHRRARVGRDDTDHVIRRGGRRAKLNVLAGHRANEPGRNREHLETGRNRKARARGEAARVGQQKIADRDVADRIQVHQVGNGVGCTQDCQAVLAVDHRIAADVQRPGRDLGRAVLTVAERAERRDIV